MARRGPKTEAGKALVSLNAVRHGALSMTPVIPGLENEEDWEVHRAGVLESLDAAGHLEQAMTELIALRLWQLQRLARYQREMAAVAQEQVEDDLAKQRRFSSSEPESIEEARDEVRSARRSVRLLEGLDQLPDDACLSGEDAAAIFQAIRDVFSDEDRDSIPTPASDDGAEEEDEDWTAGRVRQGIADVAARVGWDIDRLLEAAAEWPRWQLKDKREELRRLVRKVDQMRRERLLPDEKIMERIVRYEAHVSRQLYQAMHELEALQARRQGGQAPLARVDVQGVSEA